MRRMPAAKAVSLRMTKLEEMNPSERLFGIGVSGGVEHMDLRCKLNHQTKHWSLVLDFPNAFNTVDRAAVLEEVAIRARALTPFVAKCYGDQPADVFFIMNTGERRNITSNTGFHQGSALGSALFCMLIGNHPPEVPGPLRAQGRHRYLLPDHQPQHDAGGNVPQGENAEGGCHPKQG